MRSLAKETGVTAFLIVRENGLEEEIYEGQVLSLPPRRNGYTVCQGDTKSLLCGSAENYEKINGTDIFYIGMRVLL